MVEVHRFEDNIAFRSALSAISSLNFDLLRKKEKFSAMIVSKRAFCQKGTALAGNRTQIYCLEGNNANHYTTNAPHYLHREKSTLKAFIYFLLWLQLLLFKKVVPMSIISIINVFHIISLSSSPLSQSLNHIHCHDRNHHHQYKYHHLFRIIITIIDIIFIISTF